MPVYRIRELEKKHGDLNKVIPVLVNKYGQSKAAAALDISVATVNKWLKHNGYEATIVYLRRGSEAAQ